MYGLVKKYKKTACNYNDPITGAYVACQGGEDVTFVPCAGFGVQEARNVCCINAALSLAHSAPPEIPCFRDGELVS